MENQQEENNKQPVKPEPTGLDNWNDRLDENLESENSADPEADEKARVFSAEEGSGDQSDAADKAE
jgi:hypothetical protein